MPFNLLYPPGIDPRCHAIHMALYLQGWADGVNIPRIDLDLQALERVCTELAHPSFPHVDGLDGASPFKKVANFFVWFVHHKPVISPLPEAIFGSELPRFENHQACPCGIPTIE